MPNRILDIAIISMGFFLYGYLALRILRIKARRILHKRFFHAAISILNSSQDDEDCIHQFNLNFRKLSEKNPQLSSDIKSSVDIIEDMIFYYDTLVEKLFKLRFGLYITNDIRNRLVNIADKMREKNPFVSLHPKDANLLANLKRSIETGNADLASTILKQLSEEIEVKESNVRTQRKRNIVAFIVAIIGAFLTIFFGFLSFFK
ncbi:hypothetical protein CEE39_08360 [bacterium (candidate division B38) B3_B38]|nr:MAG: hypothetical protein CEE39_08360 [bacterium (candidate division B38) B3_B38]